MLPLTKERAKELFERDVTVYMLHEGNTEAMVFEPEDIATHSGLFGIAREDWEEIMEKETPKEQKEQDRKADESFLTARGDSFAIYQLKDTPDNRNLAFVDMEYLDRNNIPVDRGNYELVYTGSLPKYGTTEEKLDSLYDTFNVHRPADFKGIACLSATLLLSSREKMYPVITATALALQESPISFRQRIISKTQRSAPRTITA
jgi:hypothetical protein